MLRLVFLSACCCLADISLSEPDGYSTDTLVLTHVVLRHGDRAPDALGQYPTNPYINNTYYPYGMGQLTIEGKRKAYAIGKSLRKRYNKFLGDIYYPDILESITSSYPRAKMTIQLVQTGLFAPSDEYKLQEGLNWQPIEFRYRKAMDDKLLTTFKSCTGFFGMIEKLETEEPKHQEYHRQYHEMYTHLSKYSGWFVNDSIKVSFIRDAFKTQSEMGLTLPEWSKHVWPEPIQTAAKYFWKIVASTPEIRSVLVGNLLTKIVDDSINKIQGILNPPERKMFLYSGHDFNIVPLLGAFGKLDLLHLPYSTYMLLELHKINGIYGFKVYLQDYKTEDPRQIRIGGCEMFCPLDKFVPLMKDSFPKNPWCPTLMKNEVDTKS